MDAFRPASWAPTARKGSVVEAPGKAVKSRTSTLQGFRRWQQNEGKVQVIAVAVVGSQSHTSHLTSGIGRRC